MGRGTTGIRSNRPPRSRQAPRNTLMGYHSTNLILDNGLKAPEILDTDQYPELAWEVFYNSVPTAYPDFNEILDTRDTDRMYEAFEELGIKVLFTSDQPIEATAYQGNQKWKYGKYLYRIYGTGQETILDDPNGEIGAQVIVTKKALRWERVPDDEEP